ncbi:MAG: hypothetical protein GX455_15730 [Phycisphaerae bacterium]|nr:hypothetical protein [Phycisphaerae bacterium]
MKASKQVVWGFLVFVLAGGLVLAQGPSAAEKVSSRLPDDTLAFIATSGMERLKPAFDQSSIGQIWNDPDVQSFYTQIRDLILTAIRKGLADSGTQADNEITWVCDLAKEVIQSPIAAGVIEVPAENSPDMPFGLTLVIDAAKRKDKLQPLIDQFEQEAAKNGTTIVDTKIGDIPLKTVEDADIPAVWGWAQDYFVLLFNTVSPEVLKNLKAPSTKANPLSRLPGNGDLFAAYCDFQKIAGIVSRSMETEGDTATLETVRKVMDTLGVRKAQSLTVRAGISGKDLIVDKWFNVPAPQTGIFTAMKPIDRKLFARTDARSMTTMAWNVDLGVLYDVIIKAVETTMDNEQDRQEMHKAIEDFQAKAGIQIRQGLLASFDGSMVLQAYPTLVMTEVPAGGFALVAEMKDAALFEKQINALIERFGKDLKPETLQVRTGKLEGGQSQTFLINPVMSMMQIVPNWVVDNNRLILTTNPNLTTNLLKQYAADKPAFAPLSDDKTFQAVISKLPANASFLRYSDTAVSSRQVYQQLQQMWPMIMGIASGQGVNVPTMLPDIQEQLNALGKSVAYGYLDKTGFRTHYQGSGLEATGSVAGGAAALGILMPALNKTKTIAQRVVAGTNLKAIGTACHIYANDHQDKFPPNLEALIEECDLSPKSLESPRKPKNHSGPSYIYIEGQTTSNPIGNILAYEDPAFIKDGMVNVLFIDGHSEAMKMEPFRAALKKTYEQLGRPIPEESKSDSPPSAPTKPGKTPVKPTKNTL